MISRELLIVIAFIGGIFSLLTPAAFALQQVSPYLDAAWGSAPQMGLFLIDGGNYYPGHYSESPWYQYAGTWGHLWVFDEVSGTPPQTITWGTDCFYTGTLAGSFNSFVGADNAFGCLFLNTPGIQIDEVLDVTNVATGQGMEQLATIAPGTKVRFTYSYSGSWTGAVYQGQIDWGQGNACTQGNLVDAMSSGADQFESYGRKLVTA